MDKTKVFNCSSLDTIYIKQILKEFLTSLKEKGYDPKIQIIGYLMSGDPGYISNYNDARKKITNIDRAKILEVIIKEYFELCDI